MKLIIDIPEKTYQKIKERIYDYGDMNVIIQNGTPYEERPHGKIITDEDGNTSCSECGQTSVFGNFCYNCGADMRKEA